MPFYAEKIYICSVNRPERVVAGPAGYMLQGFPLGLTEPAHATVHRIGVDWI